MNTNKRLALLLALLLSLTLSHAADINLDFSITSEATTPDSVWVHNESKDTATMIDGTATLRLVATVAALDQLTLENTLLQLYPNPTRTQATLAYTTQQGGTHHIAITDMTGRQLASYTRTLSVGTHRFAMPTLAAGNYCVSVSTAHSSHANILMSTHQGATADGIAYLAADAAPAVAMKSTSAATTLPYDVGDQLQLIAYLNGETDTLTLAPQTSQTVDFDITLPVFTLAEWADAGFPANANINVDASSNSMTVNNFDDFISGLNTATINKVNGFDGRINLGFDDVDLDAADLESLVNSGQNFEFAENTGYSISGEVKTYLLEELFHMSEKESDAKSNPNFNINNSNFSNLTIDFSDENSDFTDLYYKNLNIYGNTFGRVDAKGFNWNGLFDCPAYILDSEHTEDDLRIFTMDKVFNVVGDYGVDWDIESMRLRGSNILEHADALQKLEENTSMTKADITQAIADGKISIASCSKICRVADGLDADGNLLPYMDEALTMAGDKIEWLGIASDNLSAGHPLEGKLIKVNSDVVKKFASLESKPNLYFRENLFYGEDITFEDGTTNIEIKNSVFDGVSFDGGGSNTVISFDRIICIGDVTLNNTAAATDFSLTEGANLTMSGTTSARNVWSFTNQADFDAKISASITNTVIPWASADAQAFGDNYSNDKSYQVIE